ncbi:MAG TPA: hypothetical protein VHI52_21825 [Verrucomicrobiae bacterium]|nr:hypothetical protein [Verrucomicrobiae bacterium]
MPPANPTTRFDVCDRCSGYDFGCEYCSGTNIRAVSSHEVVCGLRVQAIYAAVLRTFPGIRVRAWVTQTSIALLFSFNGGGQGVLLPTTADFDDEMPGIPNTTKALTEPGDSVVDGKGVADGR